MNNQRITIASQSYCAWALWCLMVFCVSSKAAIEFETRTDAAEWKLTSSKLECRLTHAVEGFGEAIFLQEAGEPPHFLLTAESPHMKAGKASLVASPPPWLKAGAISLGLVKVEQTKEPILIGERLTKRMMSELQKGFNLRFTRKSWYGNQQQVKVTLSGIGFNKSYREYNDCLAQLLPMSFRKLERTTVYYRKDENELSEETVSMLDQLVQYIKIDPTVKAFYIDGHTDSSGLRSDNLTISEQRAKMVQTYLVDKGIPEEAIVVRWHGERYPVATNQNEEGMAKNRRVTIRLSKEPPEVVKPKEVKPKPEDGEGKTEETS